MNPLHEYEAYLNRSVARAMIARDNTSTQASKRHVQLVVDAFIARKRQMMDELDGYVWAGRDKHRAISVASGGRAGAWVAELAFMRNKTAVRVYLVYDKTRSISTFRLDGTFTLVYSC